MKTFIVSMGIIIMGVSGLVFGWDYSQYTNLQTHLKVLTESSAAYAALCFDASEFENDSDIVYTYEDVSGGLEYFVSQASKDMQCFGNGTITVASCIPDSDNDKVTVSLSFTSSYDLFRNPFMTQYNLTHTSCYEWVSW